MSTTRTPVDLGRTGSSARARDFLDRVPSWVLVVAVCLLLVVGLGVAALVNPGARSFPEQHHAPPAGLVERD
jgi:hypothetical protein